MSDCSTELQTEILTALKNDTALQTDLGGIKIFDHVPSKIKLPYVVLGTMSIEDWSTSSDEGAEYTFDIHCWSNHRGRREVQTISAHIKRILDNQNLALQTCNLVNLQWQLSEIDRDDEARAYLSISRFRAVVEV